MLTDSPVENDVRSVLRAQRRRRRLRFWLGFVAILLIGGLWAGLTKDPARPGLFEQFGGNVAVEAPAIMVEEPAFATTIELAPPPPAPTDAPTTTVGQ